MSVGSYEAYLPNPVTDGVCCCSLFPHPLSLLQFS
uniref:Uncharacterized protein n=1 Tax=Rhizophora mucronata TaxID=61149 RepID=A0A2P2Q8N5_RHIMU